MLTMLLANKPLGAVVMSHIVEVVLTHPDMPLTPTLRDLPNSGIEVESQPITAATEPVVFFSVQTTDIQALESALTADHTVKEWQFSTKFKECRIYQVQLSSDVKLLTPTMTAFGLRVLAVNNTEGSWRFRLHTPDKHRLATFHRYCRQEDVDWQLEKVYSMEVEQSVSTGRGIDFQLTDRQREVALTATEMGYFEPEGASTKEIAAQLDITPSTLSTHLRTITAKVFTRLFQNDHGKE